MSDSTASVGIPRYIFESGTQKQFLMWDFCDCISSPCNFAATLITPQTGSCAKLGWKKLYNYLEEIGRGQHLPLPATKITKITKALIAEDSTWHVLALSTLHLFQELRVRNDHYGASLRGTLQQKHTVSNTGLKAVH